MALTDAGGTNGEDTRFIIELILEFQFPVKLL